MSVWHRRRGGGIVRDFL